MEVIAITADVPTGRKRLFTYLVDLANRPAFLDNFQREFRLSRVDSSGRGASARYRIGGPLSWHWAEFEIVELSAPRKVVELGRSGRVGRISTRTEFTLEDLGADLTRLTVTVTAHGRWIDNLFVTLGGSKWLKRQYRKSLKRLCTLFADGPTAVAAQRATVAGLSHGSDPLAFG